MRLYLTLCLLVAAYAATAQPVERAAFRSEIVRVERAARYPDHLQGRRMADGSAYDRSRLTASHRTLPLGTQVRVSDSGGRRSVVVRITDRGPFLSGVDLLVSAAAASRLHLADEEVRPFHVRVLELDPEVVEPPAASHRGPSATDASSAPARDVRQAQPPPRPQIAEDGWFAVQLGSFGSREAAKRAATGMEGAWVAPTEVGDKTVYRLYFGRYATREAASDWADRLARLGRSGFVKSVR